MSHRWHQEVLGKWTRENAKMEQRLLFYALSSLGLRVRCYIWHWHLFLVLLWKREMAGERKMMSMSGMTLLSWKYEDPLSWNFQQSSSDFSNGILSEKEVRNFWYKQPSAWYWLRFSSFKPVPHLAVLLLSLDQKVLWGFFHHGLIQSAVQQA